MAAPISFTIEGPILPVRSAEDSIPMSTSSLRLPDTLWNRLDVMAKATKRSRNDAMEHMLTRCAEIWEQQQAEAAEQE